MNVTFRIGGPGGNTDLEAAFVNGAKEAGMVGLKGHRYYRHTLFVLNSIYVVQCN